MQNDPKVDSQITPASPQTAAGVSPKAMPKINIKIDVWQNVLQSDLGANIVQNGFQKWFEIWQTFGVFHLFQHASGKAPNPPNQDKLQHEQFSVNDCVMFFCNLAASTDDLCSSAFASASVASASAKKSLKSPYILFPF